MLNGATPTVKSRSVDPCLHGSVHLDLDLQVEQVLREVDGAPDCPATKGKDAAAGLDAPVEESEGDTGRCGEIWEDMGRYGEPG